MSQLSDKIISYTPQAFAALDYAVSGNPTINPNPGALYLANGNTSADTWEPTVGPPGGAGSWKFNYATGSGYNVNWQGTNVTTALNDRDYSLGFWFKINSIPANAAINVISEVLPPTSSIASGFRFGFYGSTHSTSPGKFVSIIRGQTSVSTINLVVGQWYYFAVTRKTTNVMDMYLDGSLFRSLGSIASSTALTAYSVGHNGTISTAYSANFSNLYFATTANIDAAQIAEIWTAGSTAPVTDAVLKYWDGSAWATPLSISQWDGSSWTTFDGQVWNGTAWKDIVI